MLPEPPPGHGRDKQTHSPSRFLSDQVEKQLTVVTGQITEIRGQQRDIKEQLTDTKEQLTDTKEQLGKSIRDLDPPH